MIREVGESIGRAVFERTGRLLGQFQEASPLESDLLESEDAYLLVFDTPGAVASDIQVRYVDGTVFVRVDRFREFYGGYEMRFPGRGMALDGRATLPDDAAVNPEAADATLRSNGTLEISIPKVDVDTHHPADEPAETVPVSDTTE